MAPRKANRPSLSVCSRLQFRRGSEKVIEREIRPVGTPTLKGKVAAFGSCMYPCRIRAERMAHFSIRAHELKRNELPRADELLLAHARPPFD